MEIFLQTIIYFLDSVNRIFRVKLNFQFTGSKEHKGIRKFFYANPGSAI